MRKYNGYKKYDNKKYLGVRLLARKDRHVYKKSKGFLGVFGTPARSRRASRKSDAYAISLGY